MATSNPSKCFSLLNIFLKKYQNIWRNDFLSIILHNDNRRCKYGNV